MNALSEKTVGEWVKERPGRSRVFERFGIDYCCGGKKPLSEACREKGLVLDDVLAALEQADTQPADADVDWSQRSLTELCDHIVERHHDWLRRELPRIEFMSQKVAQVHGPSRPELVEVAQVFTFLKDEMMMHMRKEEEVLFPLIRQMDQTGGAPQFHCGSLSMPINVMEAEHDDAGRCLARMRELTGGYVAPEDACNTYRSLLSALEELELDMHEHVHKENSILFPAAQQRETELRQQ